MIEALPVILGVFFGNWLVVPIIRKDTSFTDGFWVGVIAAVICSIYFGITK